MGNNLAIASQLSGERKGHPAMPQHVGHPTKAEQIMQEISEQPLTVAEQLLSLVIKKWAREEMTQTERLAHVSHALYEVQRARMMALESGAQITALRH